MILNFNTVRHVVNVGGSSEIADNEGRLIAAETCEQILL